MNYGCLSLFKISEPDKKTSLFVSCVEGRRSPVQGSVQ